MHRLPIILFALPLTCLAQANLADTIKVSDTFWGIRGKTYVDSVEMDMTKTYLDPENIREVVKIQGPENKIYSSHAPGITLINRKKKREFGSLSDIKSQRPDADSALPRVYVIDGLFIGDTTGVQMEVTAIKSIDVLRTISKVQRSLIEH